MKMNKKTIKIMAIILLIITILFIINNPVFADTSISSGDEAKSKADNWLEQGSKQNKISADKVATILKPLANILLAIGSVVIVVVAVVIAIKYLTASPDAKGKLKAQLVGLFVSAVVLYGAYGIWAIVYTVLKDVIG